MRVRKNNRLKRSKISSFIAIIAFTSLYGILASGTAQASDVVSDNHSRAIEEAIQSPILPKDSRVPGGIAVIPLSQDQQDANITFNNKPVWTIKNNHRTWAIIGIPLSQSVGDLTYQIDGQPHTISIKDKAYKEQYLTVKKKHANPPSRDMDRINKESRLSREAFSLFSEINKNKPYSPFIMPANGPISSPFGLKRFFNEQPRRPHSGLDIAAPRGSDIIAPMAGRIVLTGDFFFNGNSIFIDHGQGLVTMYCHMDSLESRVGQWVKAGDVIGTIGATGRVTGPHLHWTVSLNNARIDPLLLLVD